MAAPSRYAEESLSKITTDQKMPDGPFIIRRENDDYVFYMKTENTNMPRLNLQVSGFARDKIQSYGKANGVNITTIDILAAIQARGTFDGWTYNDLAEELVEKLKPKASDILKEISNLTQDARNLSNDLLTVRGQAVAIDRALCEKLSLIENKLKQLALAK